MKALLNVILLGAPLLFTGCFGAGLAITAVQTGMAMKKQSDINSDQTLISKRHEITTKFEGNPDADAWLEQRQQITQAKGDRDFDKDFPRVFDSLLIAVSSLELKVNNTERQSGYLAASGIALPPSQAKAIRPQIVREWCKLNGYDPSVLDKDFKTSEMRRVGSMLNFSDMTARYEKAQRGLTFQLVKMGDSRTRVKLRFSEVYYPTELEEYYTMVWAAVDKQIFVDQNFEGAVEKRK